LVCWVFDGEGTIWYLKKSSICLEIRQGLNPNRPVRNLFNKIKRHYGSTLFVTRKKGTNRLHTMGWRIIKKEDVIYVINKILPYVELRKKDLENVLAHFKNTKTQNIRVIIKVLPPNYRDTETAY